MWRKSGHWNVGDFIINKDWDSPTRAPSYSFEEMKMEILDFDGPENVVTGNSLDGMETYTREELEENCIKVS